MPRNPTRFDPPADLPSLQKQLTLPKPARVPIGGTGDDA